MPSRYLLTPTGVNLLLPPTLHLPAVDNPAMLQLFGRSNLERIIEAWVTERQRYEGMHKTEGSLHAIALMDAFVHSLRQLASDTHTPDAPLFPQFRGHDYCTPGTPVICFQRCDERTGWLFWQRCPSVFKHGFAVQTYQTSGSHVIAVSFDRRATADHAAFHLHPQGQGMWYAHNHPAVMTEPEFAYLARHQLFRQFWLKSIGTASLNGHATLLQEIDACFEHHVQNHAAIR